MGFTLVYHTHSMPGGDLLFLPVEGLALKWTLGPTSRIQLSWLLLFADYSVACKLHVSSRKIYGKGKGGDARECVYLTAKCRTEPSLFLGGCCRSLKCAIGKEFLKEHLFCDESPYLGHHSYFLTTISATELTSLGSLRGCRSECRMSHYETSSHEYKDCFCTGCIQFLILLTVPQFSG